MRTEITQLGDVPGQNTRYLKRKRVSKLISIAAVAVFALAACTAPGSPATSSTAPEESSSVEASSASSGGVDLPLDFQISVYQGQDVLGGEQVDFSGVVGDGKPVVLNFWAGLCPPCRLEMPDLQEVHEEFGDQIVLVGVDVGTFTGLGDEQEGRALLQEVG
jgi:thiol-disulfide isomerase/thioredoxin